MMPEQCRVSWHQHAEADEPAIVLLDLGETMPGPACMAEAFANVWHSRLVRNEE